MARRFKIPHPREWKRIVREQLFHFSEPAHVKAFSAGLGVLIGLSPFWGLQTLLAVTISLLFRLNKVLTIAFSYISFPPLIPLIIYLQWLCGGLFFPSPDQPGVPLAERIAEGSLRYFTGAAFMSVCGGVLTAAITYAILLLKRKWKDNRVLQDKE
jgi:uncharacterized protein (DUF2062 family)